MAGHRVSRNVDVKQREQLGACMLHEEFVSVSKADTTEDFWHEVLRFTEILEFETVTAFVAVDRPFGPTEFFCVDNASDEYLHIADNLERARRDPVMQHCKFSCLPIVWDESTYVFASKRDMWEEQAQYGYCTGIALAAHLPEGLHFMIGMDRDRALPRCPREVARITADFQLFAVHAQHAALKVLAPPRRSQARPELTPRELETLRWTMEGKTAWEVGHILGVSEQTAVRHLNNATHKLTCVNKHQAVVKAMRMGLIL